VPHVPHANEPDLEDVRGVLARAGKIAALEGDISEPTNIIESSATEAQNTGDTDEAGNPSVRAAE